MTSKLTITRERLHELAEGESGFNLRIASHEESQELARMALAALDSEPVAWGNGCDKTVPAALRYLAENDRPSGGESSFNTAHLYQLAREIELMAGAPLYRHAQPAAERDQVRREHSEWSQSTFGNVGPVGPLIHLSKEALEAAEQPDDLSEWADMQFLLWDAQRRAGITDEQITQAMIDKLAVNKQREWPEPKDGEPRMHIKEQPAPVSVPDEHNSVIAEQLAHVLSGMDVTDHQRAIINCAVDRLNKNAEVIQQKPAYSEVPELTDSQCLEFLAVAFRHARIKGDIECDDIRLGLKLALETAPQQEVEQ